MMKTLKFKNHLADLILAGDKTVTWRLFDDKDLRLGDKLEFVKADTGIKFAEAEIFDVYEKKLRDVSDSDYDGHEKYQNQEEMLKTFKRYYNESVDLDTIVKIIKFKLLSYDQKNNSQG